MTIEADKNRLRKEIRMARDAIVEAEDRSNRIIRRLQTLDCFAGSSSIAFYVSVRSEVRTHAALTATLNSSKRISVPAVVGDSLELYEIRSMNELALGTFGVLEPIEIIRRRADRKVRSAEVDLILVPGLVFDLRGGRIGYGRGFYDRLLSSTISAVSVGLAYECQLAAAVPMSNDDVAVNVVITEERVIECGGSAV